MERTATDVASPPIAGGDLPSFDELLAKGSFHARLARARAEREKALARSGDASDDAYILNTGRKPWERGPGAPLKGDRLTEALGQSVAVKDRTARPLPRLVLPPPVALMTDPKPVVAPTAVAARRPAARLEPLAPAESLVVVPTKSARKRMRVAAGFGAGLSLGLAAAIVGSLWRDADTPSVTVASEAVAPAAIAQAPNVGTGEPGLAALSATVEPLPVASPSARNAWSVPVVRPAAPQGADAPPLGTRTGPILARVAPAAVVAPAAEDLSKPLRPTHIEFVVARVPAATQVARPAQADPLPSGVVAPPPRPSVETGAVGLAMVAPAASAVVAAAADLAGWNAPAPGRLTVPREVDGDAPLSEQPLPAAYSVPEPAETRALAASLFPGPVVLHAPESVADAALAEAVDRLGAAGVRVGDPSRVGFTVSESNVRYFHAADAEAAAAIADTLGARLRDFTSFAPAPPAGTIEVWLAGNGGSGSATARKSTNRTRTAQDQRLLNLRSRILQQLRNGDHL